MPTISSLAFAQADSPLTIPRGNQTPLGEGPVGFLDILNRITDWMYTILLVLAVIFIILAAFHYLTSGGSEEKVGKAHKMLIYTAIAVAVALLARAVIFVTRELVAPGANIGG